MRRAVAANPALCQPDSAVLSLARASALLDQDLAPADRIRGSNNSLILHNLDDAGGLVVADGKPPLDIACRASAIAGDDGDGMIVKLGVRIACGRKAKFGIDRRLGFLIEYRSSPTATATA